MNHIFQYSKDYPIDMDDWTDEELENDSFTFLSACILYCPAEKIRKFLLFLLKKGANINLPIEGNTALYFSLYQKNIDIAFFLIENGADIDNIEMILRSSIKLLSLQLISTIVSEYKKKRLSFVISFRIIELLFLSYYDEDNKAKKKEVFQIIDFFLAEEAFDSSSYSYSDIVFLAVELWCHSYYLIENNRKTIDFDLPFFLLEKKYLVIQQKYFFFY